MHDLRPKLQFIDHRECGQQTAERVQAGNTVTLLSHLPAFVSHLSLTPSTGTYWAAWTAKTAGPGWLHQRLAPVIHSIPRFWRDIFVYLLYPSTPGGMEIDEHGRILQAAMLEGGAGIYSRSEVYGDQAGQDITDEMYLTLPESTSSGVHVPCLGLVVMGSTWGSYFTVTRLQTT